jgi:hypothetical protein
VRQVVVASCDASPNASNTYRYVVTDAVADGPCKRSVVPGDQILSIDGHDVDGMDINAFIGEARGRPRCNVATSMLNQLDPLRRLIGMRPTPRSGRGSRALLRIARTKKDGRRQTRDVWLIRGNWMGMLEDRPDGAAEAAGAGGARARPDDKISLVQWLRDLLAAPPPDADAAADPTGQAPAGGAAAAADDGADERLCRICQCSEVSKGVGFRV